MSCGQVVHYKNRCIILKCLFIFCLFFFCFLLHLIIGRIALPSFLMKCPNLERAPKYILQQHDKKAQQQKSFDIQRPVPMT